MGTSRVKNKRHNLDRILNEEGWVLITSLFVLPLFIAILIAGVEIWGVSTIHQGAESLKYNALAKMQVNGGLTLADKQILQEKLIDLGAEPDTLVITGDILESGKQPVLHPNEVTIRIEFTPKHFNNFLSRTLIGGDPGEPLKIGVGGSALSEKIQ